MSDLPVTGTSEVLPDDVLGARVTVGVVGRGEGAGLRERVSVNGVIRLRAEPDRAWVEVDGVGRFVVAGGAEVTIDPDTGATVTGLRAWLHGTVAALVMAQQGRFALHASVVDVAGSRIAVAGRKGAGKSTTVLAVVAAGGSLVADDVAVLDLGGARAEVVPFGRSLHVAPDVARRLRVDVTDAPSVVGGVDKVSLAAPLAALGPLDAIVVLVPDSVSTPAIAAIDGMDAVKAVRRHTFRAHLVQDLCPTEAFAWQVSVAHRVPVHRLRRPRDWSVDAVVAALSDLATGRGP